MALKTFAASSVAAATKSLPLAESRSCTDVSYTQHNNIILVFTPFVLIQTIFNRVDSSGGAKLLIFKENEKNYKSGLPFY